MAKDEKLKRLKAIRSGNRGVVTKYTKEAIELLNEEDKLTTVSERLNTIGSLLNEKIERLKELDCQILDLCDVADIVKVIDETEEIYSRVCDVQVEITKFTSQSIDKTSKNTEQAAETSDIILRNKISKVSNPRLVKLFLYRARRRARTRIQHKTRTRKYRTRIQPQARTCLILLD